MKRELELQKLADEIKGQGFKAICFWLPSYGVGGGVLAFYRFAVCLREKTDLNVYYVDYEGGYLQEMLHDAGISLIPYRDEDYAFSLQEKCVIITNSTRPILLQQMRPDNKLLFWHWDTAPCAWELVFLQNEAENYFQLCMEKGAMVFHDWSSWDILSQNVGFEFKKAFLPVYIDPHGAETDGGLICEIEMHLTWLGRLVPDKIYSLFYVIENLAQYPTERKKVFHIIGDGRSRKEVERYCARFGSKIVFDFRGTMDIEELDEFLVENSDVLFAMGTSVLEGAARKIPAAVVLLGTAPIRSDEFFWIFDSKEYCCGVLTTQKKRFGAEYSHFRDMMDDIFEYGMKKELGERCFQYYEKHHSGVGYTAGCLLEVAKNSSMTMGDLQTCIRYVPYHHIKLMQRTFFGRRLSDKVIFETDGGET